MDNTLENKSGPLSEESQTPLLDQIDVPADIRGFDDAQLRQLADEVRIATIQTVSKTGGHLGASLGVVELTTAIHAVFNTPEDKLIFDVGHQCYPHKILTGRKNRMHTLRQGGGISGFTKRSESEFDPFGAAHSSTSISAALGMAVARDLQGHNHKVIAVIGDGALSAGMAYEALNNVGVVKSNLIVILNDNQMSIAPPVGAMSEYLTTLPSPDNKNFFEEMGFDYIGVIDGHDMTEILSVLRDVKNANRPVLVHVKTQKGKGYKPAEIAKDKMHGVAKFDVIEGGQCISSSKIPSYTKVFAASLIAEAHKDNKIVGVTAAMPDGTGMDLFASIFPNRMFDVGIAEQHAVTFAAGLAAEGMKPFVALYSTFLQRGYDQVVHDVAIQNLPVRFAIDRAGLVGADGQTHAGAFDTAYLGCLPNMVLMAASDEVELKNMVATAAAYDQGPIAFRYPRGEGVGVDMRENSEILDIGKGRIVCQGSDVAILSYGGRLQEAKKAAEVLKNKNISCTVADARFAKPLDTDLIDQLVDNHQALIVIEEGSIGGFGSYVLEYCNEAGHMDHGQVKIRTMHLPDVFQSQDTPDQQYHQAQLCCRHIVDIVTNLLH